MAKKAKVNLTVNSAEHGQLSFEKGKVYPDSAITKEIDASNFETVSDAALDEEVNDEENTADGEGEGETKKTRRTKKTPGEDLE